MTSRSVNSRAVRRISSCSSVSAKSMERHGTRRLADVDPFALIILGGLAWLVASLLLLGLLHPRTGAQALDWKPTRSPELEIQNEIDDLDQMLEAANARRRRRGLPELTEEGVRASVGADLADTIKRREAPPAELESAQRRDANTAPRRAKGRPETTIAEYRRSLLGDDA